MSKPANLLQVVIFLTLVIAGAAFLPLAVLAATDVADPRFAAAAFGVALIAVGSDGVAGALVADWARGEWKLPRSDRPTVPEGRLTSLGSGLLLGSAGVLMIGLDRAPLPARLAAVAVFVVGFALTLVGQSYDRRQGEAARGGSRGTYV